MIRVDNKISIRHGTTLYSGGNGGYLQAVMVSNQSINVRVCLLYACINYKTVSLRPVCVCKNPDVVCWQRFIK